MYFWIPKSSVSARNVILPDQNVLFDHGIKCWCWKSHSAGSKRTFRHRNRAFVLEISFCWIKMYFWTPESSAGARKVILLDQKFWTPESSVGAGNVRLLDQNVFFNPESSAGAGNVILLDQNAILDIGNRVLVLEMSFCWIKI